MGTLGRNIFVSFLTAGLSAKISEEIYMEDYTKFLISECHTGYKDSTELTPRDLRELTRDGREPYLYSIHTDGDWGSETIDVSVIFGDDTKDESKESHYIVTFESSYDRETKLHSGKSPYAFTDVFGVIPEYVAKAQAKLAVTIAQGCVDEMHTYKHWHFEEEYGYYIHFDEIT